MRPYKEEFGSTETLKKLRKCLTDKRLKKKKRGRCGEDKEQKKRDDDDEKKVSFSLNKFTSLILFGISQLFDRSVCF